MNLRKKTIIIFLFILGVGICVRFLGLGKESFWLDEFFSFWISGKGVTDIISSVKHSTDMPLYHLLLHFWRYIFGQTEWGIRSFSAFIGALTIVLFFLTARSLMGDKESLIGSLIFALAPFHIYYSQEARAYALLAFVTMGCIYFTTKISDSRKYSGLVGLLVFEVATLYTHYYGLFVIATLNLYMAYLILIRKEDVGVLKSWIVVQIAVLILYAPWISVFIKRLEAGGASPHATSYSSISGLKHSWAAFFLKGNPWSAQLNKFLQILTVLGIFFGIINIKNTKREYILSIDKNKKLIFLVALLFIPMSLVYVIGKFTHIYSLRSLIIILGPICMLLGLSISKFKVRIQIFILAFYIFLTSLSIYGQHQHPQKEQWREAATYINDNAQSGDVAVVCAHYMKSLYNHYSGGQIATIGINRYLREDQLMTSIDQILINHQRIWLILSHATGSPIKKYMVNENKQTILLEHKKLRGIDISLVKTINLKGSSPNKMK